MHAMANRRAEREEMAARHLSPRGIRDRAVLAAMLAVPREDFLPVALRTDAYGDHPLPIGDGQTISQPYIVALMAEEARLGPHDRVLEIGTGSGYAAAVLAEIAGEVVTVERIAALAETAARRLERWPNVTVVVADGTNGCRERAPFDAIIAAAAGPEIPEPWLDQLAEGGRIVMPLVRDGRRQQLVRAVPGAEGRPQIEELGGVSFVPLVGEHGFES